MEVRLRKTRITIAVISFRRKIKEKAVLYKGGKCKNCSYDKCIAALEFHHRDPSEKEFRLSSGKTRNWELTKKELDKCDLLCANCHREVHDEWKANKRAEQAKTLALIARKPSISVKCGNCNEIVKICSSRIKLRTTFFCSVKCSSQNNERIQWPTNSEIKELVWQKPITTLAKEWSISDRAISKHCSRRGIPTPGPGYWAKLLAV